MWVKMSEIVSNAGLISDKLSITMENVELVDFYGQKQEIGALTLWGYISRNTIGNTA